MYDGMFVFDNVVHMFDNSDDNVIEESAVGYMRRLRQQIGLPDPGEDQKKTEVEYALNELFRKSSTDMAMAQTVPLFSYWRDGFAPARRQYELKEACPQRVLFCGGVDPLFQGLEGALEEMERQVRDWGAVSMKFYQAHSEAREWRADDPEIAYPLWELAVELGLSHVQFHKGVPLGKERVEALRPNDVQLAAADFPDLVFVLHHLGDPYIDETINIAARFENVWLSLSFLIDYLLVAPWQVYEVLGKALVHVGPDRLLWGSEAFARPIEPFIQALADAEMPEELQNRYGYPQISQTDKRMILGENYARLVGIDIDKKLTELAD